MGQVGLKRLALAAVAVISSGLIWWPLGLTRVAENYDGPYYLAIAKVGYSPQKLGQKFSFNVPGEYFAAHLPGYPGLIAAVRYMGIAGPSAMLIVTLAGSVAGCLVWYEIARREKWPDPEILAAAWLFVWPRMWAVRSVGSPETWFITAIMASLWAFSRKKYVWATVAGIAAVLLKTPGILLIPAYGLWAMTERYKTGKWPVKWWITCGIGIGLAAAFLIIKLQTGNWWAYFNSGDNIHLQMRPFAVFNSKQPWVGNWWLEDIIWIYAAGAIGVSLAWKYNRVWASFGTVFLTAILFVSHRDIARYSLPVVPVVLLGTAGIWRIRAVRWTALGLLIPLYFYTLNFMLYNRLPIANWWPFW